MSTTTEVLRSPLPPVLHQPAAAPIPSTKSRLAIIGGIVLLTVSIHYGWVLEPIFGEHHWIHAIHGRLCYIPIIVAASWFGIRGGLWTAGTISLLVLPYLFLFDLGAHNFAGEVTEIIFYFALAAIVGALVGREFRARREQQETQLALERSQRLSLVGQMAAGVAHEIKNPMASIKGAIEILCDPATPESDRDEFRDIAIRETRRIDRTVRDFLEFGRPKEPALVRMDLSETVTGTLRQVEATVAAAGVALVRKVEPGVPVIGDAEKIHQVLLNLLLNAMEASSRNGCIEVSVDRSGRFARLTVADAGSGISPDDLERVFDPFFTTKSAGSGLGLAVARQIIGSHGGTITASARDERGTLFTILLPLAEEA